MVAWTWLLIPLHLMLWSPTGTCEDSCKIAMHLAPIIAGYDHNDVINAILGSSSDWKHARNTFRSSYLHSKESINCISDQPMLFSAVDEGDLVVSIVLGDDSNAFEQEYSIIGGITNSLVSTLDNFLSTTTERPVSIFLLSPSTDAFSGIAERLGQSICDNVRVQNCRSHQLSLGPLMSFTSMCASDLLVLATHHDMSLYVAALCSNHMILTSPSMRQYDTLFSNVVPMSPNPPLSSAPSVSVSKENLSFGGGAGTHDDWVIDKFGTIKDKFDEAGTPWPTSINVETCRGNQILEPTKDQVNAGASACQFRSEPVDYQSFKSDFDVMRKAVDICDEEFSKGNVNANRLYRGYRSAEACVVAVMKRLRIHVTFEDEGAIGDTMLGGSEAGRTWLAEAQSRLQYDTDNNSCDINWMWELGDHERRYYSQGGQDGVLQRIFEMIGTSNQFFVEFGFNANTYTPGSNSYYLHKLGWKGVIIDDRHENHDINLHREFLTRHNVVDILDRYNVPMDPDYVSIDIDSQDLWILEAIIGSDSKYRPRVISIEYNSHFPLAASLSLPPHGENEKPLGWDGFDTLYGASAGAIRLIANMHGYEMVHVIKTFDVFLVRKDLLNGACPPPFASFAKKGSAIHFCVHTPSRRNQWIDVQTYLSTKDVPTAQFAAQEIMLLLYNPISESHFASADCLGFDLLHFQSKA